MTERLSFARAAFAWTIFPTVLSGAVAFTIWQMGRGVDPTVAFVGPPVAAYFLLMGLDACFPSGGAGAARKGTSASTSAISSSPAPLR